MFGGRSSVAALVTLSIVLVSSAAAQPAAEGAAKPPPCELFLRQSETPDELFIYLLTSDKNRFVEVRTKDEIKAAAAQAFEGCLDDYFDPPVSSVNDELVESLLFHFRNVSEVAGKESLTLRETALYSAKKPLSTFAAQLQLKWQDIRDVNGLSQQQADNLSARRLLLPRHERQLRIVWLEPSDLPDPVAPGFYSAPAVLASLSTRGVGDLYVGGLVPPLLRDSATGPESETVTTSTGLWPGLKDRLVNFRKLYVAYVTLAVGLALGFALALLTARALWQRNQIDYARGTRFRALAKKLDTEGSVSSAGDAEEFFERRNQLLLNVAERLEKLVPGDGSSNGALPPEGQRFDQWFAGRIELLRKRLTSQGDAVWRQAAETVAKHNRRLGLAGAGAESVRDEATFQRLLEPPAEAFDSLRKILADHTDAPKDSDLVDGYQAFAAETKEKLGTLEESRTALTDLLSRRPGASSGGPLVRRYQHYFENVVEPQRGELDQLARVLDERLPAGLADGDELSEKLRTYLDGHVAPELEEKRHLQKRLDAEGEAASNVPLDRRFDDYLGKLAAALENAQKHLTDYYVTAGILRRREDDHDAGASGALTRVRQVEKSLAGLKLDAENQRKEKFINQVLRIAMEASVHLNQAISIWRGKGDATIAVRMLASGLDKLNLYALALLEGKDLKPRDASVLLIGDDERPGQLTALLKLLAVIATLRAYTAFWNALARDVRNGLASAEEYLRLLLEQLGIRAHQLRLLVDPAALEVDFRTEKSLIVLEEEPFKQELGELHRTRTFTSPNAVVELKQLGFDVDPEGLSSLKLRAWPTFLCVARESQLARYAREYT